MAKWIWVNIGSGNDLLPDCTKPFIIWTSVDFSLVRFCGIHLRAILQRVSTLQFSIMRLKIVLFKNYQGHELITAHLCGIFAEQPNSNKIENI